MSRRFKTPRKSPESSYIRYETVWTPVSVQTPWQDTYRYDSYVARYISIWQIRGKIHIDMTATWQDIYRYNSYVARYISIWQLRGKIHIDMTDKWQDTNRYDSYVARYISIWQIRGKIYIDMTGSLNIMSVIKKELSILCDWVSLLYVWDTQCNFDILVDQF
jgi:predicted membrane protein